MAPAYIAALMNRLLRRLSRCLFLVMPLGLLLGCSVRPLAVRALADELAAQGQSPEDDLVLARDAAPFYLKLSEAVLAQAPEHLPLATAVTAHFTQYAYAFVAFEAEQLEAEDARGAQRLRERAARLYRRAQQHGLAALGSAPLRDEQVALAYWTAAAWSAWISLAKDQPDTVADLPLALRLAEAAFARDPDHGEGQLATLLGQLEASRPGGNPAKAQAYFARARAAGPRHPGVPLAEAETLAANDRARHEALLREALAKAAGRQDLPGQLARQRAQWLLATLDDRF